MRFYERELPDFFEIRKTAGGHRRYSEENVRQFLMVRKMAEADGVRLSEIKEKISRKVDLGSVQGHVDLLLSVYDAMTREIDRLRDRLEAVEREVATLRRQQNASSQQAQDSSRKKRWF